MEIRQPADPAAPIKQVAAGRVDLAISYEPEVLRARDQGLNVVSVGAIVRKPLTSIISLPEAKIRKPADLKGKTVGTAGIDYQSAYLADDPRRGERAARLGQGAQRRLQPDAGAADRQGRRGARRLLELRGRSSCSMKRKRPQIIRMDQAGVPTYDELVLVANADALERDADKIRAFIGALSRGVRDLRADPDKGDPGAAQRQPRPRPGAPAGLGQGDPARCSCRRRASPSAGRTRRSGTPSAPGCRRRTCSSDRRTCARPTTTRCCRARGCRPYSREAEGVVTEMHRMRDVRCPGGRPVTRPASRPTVLVQVQRERVDAVALTRRTRPVREHVAEVAAAARAGDLGAGHLRALRPSPRPVFPDGQMSRYCINSLSLDLDENE